jgi:hypothetical protein
MNLATAQVMRQGRTGANALILLRFLASGVIKHGNGKHTIQKVIFQLKPRFLQCGAPKIANLVYKSNNYGLWYL